MKNGWILGLFLVAQIFTIDAASAQDAKQIKKKKNVVYIEQAQMKKDHKVVARKGVKPNGIKALPANGVQRKKVVVRRSDIKK